MIHYSCIGATGYVCGEVLRMMVDHPDGELVNVLDTYGVGDAISARHPALRGFYDQTILDLTEENVRETARKSDVVMIQVPSGAVAEVGGDRSRRRLPHHRHRRGHPLPRREGLGEVVRRRARRSPDDP